jgi:Tfp pilus tip-associated adhesin PilY1
MFTSIIPGDDGCTVDGDGWLYELDPQWGSRLKFSVFDLDRDGTFGDGNDLVGDLPASGRRVGMGGGLTARGNSKYVGGKDGIQSIANNPEHSPYIGRKIGPLEFR